MSRDVHGLQTSGSHCLQRTLNKILKSNILQSGYVYLSNCFYVPEVSSVCIKIAKIPTCLILYFCSIL